MKKIIQNKKGFTLIELMVVMAIIGILVTIVIVAIDPVRQIQNAQDARIRSDLQAIKTAFQLYYNDKQSYPTGTGGVPNFSGGTWSSGGCWSSAPSCGGTIYMKQYPTSPRGGSYVYYYTGLMSGTSACSTAPCTDYVVSAILNNSNSDDANTLTKCTGVSAQPTTGGYNYEVCND